MESNLDLVPSLLFLRALSAAKLSAQFKNDLDRMVRCWNGIAWDGMGSNAVHILICTY